MACCESGDVVNKVSTMKLQDDQENLPDEEARSGSSSVCYYRDPTRCDCKTIIKECAELAMDVYNKTHLIKYNLVDLVHETGHLSSISTVNLNFIAEAHPDYVDHDWDEDARKPKTFRTRVSTSSTHKYVEFVAFDSPALT